MDIKDYVRYEDGKLFWIKSPNRKIHVGDEAFGGISKNGYKVFGFNKRVLYVHRVVFYLCYGYWGKRVDHKDRDKLNNLESNLRDVANSHNIQNTDKRENCTSKHKGVYWAKREQKWIADINLNGKKYRCGTFDNEDDAGRAYNVKALELYGEDALLNQFDI